MRALRDLLLGTAIIAVLFAMTTTSCTNDPIITDPIDTMPPDTMIPIDTSEFCDPDTIYFRRDVLPIVLSSCGMDLCHSEGTMSGEVQITSYSTLINSGIVEPFDPEGSMMYQLMTEDDLTEIMPPSPRGPISDTNILVVRRWIEQGAQNLDCPDTTCNITTPVSFQKDVFPIIDKYCVGCHSGNNPWAGLFLRTYEEIAESANNGDLVGVIAHEPGFSPMPENGEQIPDCEIDKVRMWVEAGFPNN